MKTRSKDANMLQARNALRPFFNSQKKLRRASQFQTIRQTVPLNELPQLYRLTEENPAYRFPGLGNTFPKNPSTTPDSTLRGLVSLGLAREMRLHVGRLNHHAPALLHALTDLANINDATRAGSWTELEAMIAEHTRKHGLSFAILRKDLLTAFQNAGLSGLSRRYKQRMEGCEHKAWGLLAHIVYDLMDPALSPQRATRKWLRTMTDRAARSSFYARIAVSELLTCWPTKDLLADSLLRYSGSSLLDLILCLWKAINTRSDWPEVASASASLDDRLLAILTTRFSKPMVTVPESYLQEGKGPTDLDIFRASFFFQEDGPVARWRAMFIPMIYPEAAGNDKSASTTFVVQAITAEVNSEGQIASKNIKALVADITGSIVELGVKVSATKLVTSVVVADFLRRYKSDEALSPEQLIQLLALTSSIYDYVPSATFEKLLAMERFADSNLCIFMLRDVLFRQQRSQDRELDRRAAFMRLFSIGGRHEIIQLLDEVKTWSLRTARQLAALCTRNFLERLYLLISSVKEVIETRISVCNWLLAHSSRVQETIREECEALERELTNLDARSDLDSTRVHVDEESLREWYDETQRSNELRYKQTVLAEGSDSTHGTFLDFYNKSREKPEDIGEEEDLFADTQIGSEFTLLSILESTLQAFVTDRTFGLDSYLSRRIRHGTLRGFLITPIARVRRRITDDLQNEERAAERADFEIVAKHLDGWLAAFAERLDHLRRAIIQVRSSRHPEGLIEATWRTSTNVRHLDAMIARTRARVIENRGDYEIFSDVYLLCWDFLERDLAQLRLHLNREFYRDVANELITCYNDLTYDQRVIASKYWGEVHLILKGRVEEVCGWFVRPVFRRDAYDLQTLTESTVSIVRELDDSYVFNDRVDISEHVSVNRGSFDVLGDILFVLIGNAAKHGKVGGLVEVRGELMDEQQGLITLEVTSEVESLEALERAITQMEYAAHVPDLALILSAGVGEGFSGIRKIMGVVSRIRAPEADFSLSFSRAALTVSCRIVAPSNISFARERT